LEIRNTLNIAHRGFHKEFPDNTLEAFEAAIRLGVDGIELDVNETADHEFIVFHDTKLSGKDIKYFLLSEIRSVRLNGEFEIPALGQVLDLCRKRTRLMIELKKVWSLDKFLTLLRDKAELSDIIVISFNRGLVSELKRLAPDIKTGIITAFSFRDPVKLATSARCDAVVVRFPSVNSKLVDKARASSLSIFAWGCPDIKAARKLMRLDLDGLISDFPDQIKEELG
jgi:glycerophosphoryl diester phosphodiesterase